MTTCAAISIIRPLEPAGAVPVGQGSTFMTIKVDGHHLFTSVAWDLAHEQLVIADASGVVQVWNTYTESVRTYGRFRHKTKQTLVNYFTKDYTW